MGVAARLVSGCALALLTSSNAAAGWVEGPYVVWYNLSNDPQPLDTQIRQFAESKAAHEQCWDNGASLYMRQKPAAINRELVELALIRQDAAAIAKLNRILKKPFLHASEGFDGIIAYSDENGPENGPVYRTLTTGKKRVTTYKIDSRASAAEDICAAFPPITRKP